LAAIGHLRLGGATSERLLLTGANMSAAEAYRIGWLAGLIDSETSLDDAAQSWYREHVAGLSAYALRQTVKVSRRSSGMLDALGPVLDQAERQYVEEVVTSHDGNEGIESFLERRKPVWQHD
jgi:enoyl-CoA hydratase/carnithine racemase